MTDTLDRPSAKSDLKVVGTRPIRPDGADKVTGRAQYGADFHMAGQLHGRIKRSPHAHARIVSIDTRKARALPGVKAIVTSEDFPELGDVMHDGGEGMNNLGYVSSNIMARGKALYDGHAVAAVAAISPSIAEAALDLIEVKYEVLPHVIDVDEAMAPGAPLLHDDMQYEGQPSNIAKRYQFGRGDVDAALAAADVVVEGEYKTQPVHQGYIEPHACVVGVGADGRADVWASSQGAFMVRSMTALVTGTPVSNVRVTPAEIGGGFGGKTVVYLEPVALLLSKKSGAPVKMVMSREEVFRATGPTSGSSMKVRIGAKSDGTIVAADVEMKFQAGAFPGSPVSAACMTVLSCYDIPVLRVVGWDVVTNSPKVAAYRAPGAPIGAFAVESAMDDLALKLGLDPIAFREKNASRDGTVAAYGATFQDIGYVETLEAVREHPNLKAKLGPNQGRGVAVGFWFNFGGESSASIHLGDDGTATVATASPDIGGSRASMAMMASEVLGVSVDKIRPIVADTSSIGHSMVTGGSRTTFATGMAVIQATEKAIAELKRRASMLWDVPVETIEWKAGAAHGQDAKGEAKSLTLEELTASAGKTGGSIGAEVTLTAQGAGPGFAVHVVDVEVDPETGYVKILRYTAGQDVGRAIHPSYVEGQIQGGAVQGIGWALNEEYVFDRDGKMENPGFLDYRVPVASDLPMIDAVMVEVPNPKHPYGVKGVGEVPIVPPLAAVANAVRAATGVRINSLPLSPPRILASLEAAKG
jgi:CO/xanthine dehydrogenase Mo-binding subunit